MVDDGYQLLFFGGSALLLLVQSIRGWRLGVVRQLVNLAALLLAYAVALLCGKLAAPLFGHFHWPGPIVSLAAGSLVGCVVYIALVSLGAVLFRRTDQQGLRLVRLGYGAGGSAIGVVGGLVMVWLAVLAVRLLGTVAEGEVNLARQQAADSREPAPEPSQVAVQLAHLKHSLDQGSTGAVIGAVDPIPQRVYGIAGKIARVLSSVEAMNRFSAFPGARALSQNPRIVALRTDPDIVHSVQRRDLLSLLANRRIGAVLDDPQVGRLARQFDLEKALDYALAITEKEMPPAHSFNGSAIYRDDRP